MSEDAIVLIGLDETLDALKQFDKQAKRDFTRVLNSELSRAKTEAQSLVTARPPLSGWATVPAANPRTRGGAGWPSWDQSVIKAGISVTKAQGKVRGDYTTSAGSLKNRSAAGVIYEVAGRKNKFGKGTFIRNLSRKDGPFMPSRLVWHVVDKSGAEIRRNIFNALENAKEKLQRSLDQRRTE